MKQLFKTGMITLCLTLLASGAWARLPLKDVEKIWHGLVFTGMAYEISEQCTSIEARRLRGISYLYSLRRHARDLGYSEAEIEAYLADTSERDRLIEIAEFQLARLGVIKGDEASYCAAGQAQIAANTRVGWLLR